MGAPGKSVACVLKETSRHSKIVNNESKEHLIAKSCSW